jgi:allantoin racemase
MTDLGALPEYRRSLTAAAERVAGDAAEVSVHGVRPGTYPEGLAPIEALRSPWLHHLLETQIVLRGLEAAEQGADAITIGCFYDPGVLQLRDLLEIPVFSAFETSMRVATSEGGACALVALDEPQVEALSGLVTRGRLEGSVTWIRAIEPPVTEPQLDVAVVGDDLLDVLTSYARDAAREGAEVFVPAEGTLNALLARSSVTELAGLPVIDATAALLLRALASLDAAARRGDPDRADEKGAARAHMQAVTADLLRDSVAGGGA